MAKMQHKLRHIAVSVPNVAEAQKFFEEAFGMWKAGDAGRGVYMTDGVMNVALLDYKGAKITGSLCDPISRRRYTGPSNVTRPSFTLVA